MVKSLTNASTILLVAKTLDILRATNAVALGVANKNLEAMIGSTVSSVSGITPTIDDVLAIVLILEIARRILNGTVRLVTAVVVLATILAVVTNLFPVCTRHN
jgi:hypothetical protein